MKIKFILPYSGDPDRSLLTNYDFTMDVFFKRGRKDVTNRMPFMSLAFPILAALTPPEFDMEILDESVEPIDFDDPVDIVALTGMTYMAPYAYRIAEEYKKRGVYVVMGGVHVSLAVDEALQYVDSVFVGESENTWVQFIEDFKNKTPQKVYRDSGIVEFDKFVLPRWDLVKNEYYMPYFIQASRGCCFDCIFCQIHLTFGKKIRYKPVEHVLAEIKQLQKLYGREFWGGSPIIFSDDNIIANVPAAKKLFEALIPLKLKWCALASTNVGRNEKLLDLMNESGCDHLFIGFESISQESMDLMNKGSVNKVDLYIKDIENLHSKGINVSSLMMYGMDGDDKDIFRKTVDFVKETDLEYPLFHTLLPLPGTVLTKELEDAKRIITYDWEKYTGCYSCITPKKMTPAELEQGSDWSTKQVYSEEALLNKIDSLYEKGAMRGDRPYYFMRSIVTLYLFKEMLFREKATSRFIRKIIKRMWTKRFTKISAMILFIDHFDYAQKRVPDVAPLTTANTEEPTLIKKEAV
ncbi:MAG: B12-binding domain-containing radical SAM protein [bacterium]|nr:B12-binding domain-containing radical SAM protein [bacterium]